jgi:hypothetical protein
VGCGNNIASINSAKGNTVDLEGTSDKENTLGEVLQENDAFAAETTSEEDKNGTRSES